jgi:hypothetical protein
MLRKREREKASAAKGLKKQGREPKSSARVPIEEATDVAGANLQGEGEEADAPVRTDNIRQPETGLLQKAPAAKMY